MFTRTKNLQLSVIKQIEIRAAKYPDVISLAQGIPSFDTPACIKRRVERALKNGVVAKYSLSPGLPELREMIEISLAKENMYYDWQKEIIVTVGAIEAISAAILAISQPGDEIILPSPSYTSYKEVVRLAGCTPVFVPLNETAGWAFELAKFAKAITPKTKAILFCNPNNPTGTIYSRQQLIGLAKLAAKHNFFIISDEVYKNFIYGSEEKMFSLAELPEMRKFVIRIFSFSKAYAMTGWRVGFIHSDESIVSEILKVHDALVTCAPVISQYAALGALEMGERDVLHFKQQYQERRDLICSRLNKLNNFLHYIKPNSAYFVFPKVINHNDSFAFALELLDKIQVAVVPGVAFGPNGEGHIRLSFGRTEAQINGAFDRLERYFKA
ncbi:MAG: Aromatic amino acid aminotransferase [Parcubacteria group bacterium GW2011_GWC2_42_12]|nr:MAG: Aromatic amino acid aminotransferase [Parcubacteria group bacterium GW2011_GWC2_42_12]KKT45224.1 MAG: Aromatic amino acid aminotransferase [Parcubacteria group bacterium GW2011_GWA2_44_15]